jgi:hypothetical protein
VLGQVPAERLRPDAGGPQHLRGAEGVGGHHDRAGGDRRALAGGHVDGLDAGRAVSVEQHPAGQRAGAQLDVRSLPQVPGDDRGAGPVQRAVLPDGDGDRHGADRATVRPVEEVPEDPLHRAGQRGAVERVGGDGQQFLGPGQRLVQDLRVDAVGYLVVDRSRAGRRPVGAHPADVRGDGRVGHGLRTDEHGARSGRGPARQRTGPGGEPGEQAVALLDVGDVLDVPTGRLPQRLPGLEDDDAQGGCPVGQLAGDRRPDGPGTDDQDVTVGGHRATAGWASSRRLSMSCWARIWSKAL